MILALHHVQLAMPRGGEPAARQFYGGVLGLPEVAKPAALAGRGGCWFESGELRLHLGVETPFVPARKAHPGLQVADLSELCARLDRHGIAVTPDAALPGLRRVHVADPFGNRLELLELLAPGPSG
ncbi:VOC family protein [Frigidibacter sp. MR17.24]|uniref:VOC family protein n=1 Tax=Frigidibacter sp. MR17.24 TaxID=3127345 RepID=UPI003012B5D7